MLRRPCHRDLFAPSSPGGIEILFDDGTETPYWLDRKSRRHARPPSPGTGRRTPAPHRFQLKAHWVLNALLRARTNTAAATSLLRSIRLPGPSFACSHPPLPEPPTVSTAIAYSCNCFVPTSHRVRRANSPPDRKMGTGSPLPKTGGEREALRPRLERAFRHAIFGEDGCNWSPPHRSPLAYAA